MAQTQGPQVPEVPRLPVRPPTLAGVGTAFYFKKYRPAKYEQAGRLINEGL